MEEKQQLRLRGERKGTHKSLQSRNAVLFWAQRSSLCQKRVSESERIKGRLSAKLAPFQQAVDVPTSTWACTAFHSATRMGTPRGMMAESLGVTVRQVRTYGQSVMVQPKRTASRCSCVGEEESLFLCG